MASSGMSQDSTSSNYPACRDPSIRHSGRAHIRGKIRRVWRPRYLELCDSGFVRYYELPPLADITMPEEADWQHVNMVIKDTLIIHHARIIDVTTLRDLHVGLPRGSFGFLFRGQRVGGGNHNINGGYDFHDSMDIGQSCSANSSEVNPPREYFCAVSTLEEAQSWVIALQWSVKACHKTLMRLRSMSDSDYYDHDNDKIIATKIEKPGDPSTEGHIPGANTTIKSTQPTVKNRSKSGRILLTRVHDFRIIKIPYFARWEVAYEVALLLVDNNEDTVEERGILLTVLQLETMLIELSANIQNRAPLLHDLLTQMNALPRFQSNNGTWSAQMIESSITKMNGILRSLAMEALAVNAPSMRRLFGLDNSRPITEDSLWWKARRIYSVPSSDKKKESTNDSVALVLYRQSRSVPSTMKVEDYVRLWIARPPKSLASLDTVSRFYSVSQVWLLQRPWFLLAGLGVLIPLAYSTSQIYQQSMISVTIRFDVIALTWSLAYWLGHRRGRLSQHRKIRNKGFSQRYTRSQQAESSTVTAKERKQQESRSNHVDSSIIATEEDIIQTGSLDESIYDDGDDLEYRDNEMEYDENLNVGKLSSPIPKYPENNGASCWSEPRDPGIFCVRGRTYLEDRIKVPSGNSPFKCRGVDLWLTDNPQRHIARHPSVLGGKLEDEHTFLVNFLLPFGNFVAYFSVPPLSEFPNKEVASVWSGFVNGDQQYRDARLKLLPLVIDGPWIVKAAVGNGKSPALLGKVIPLQYFFRKPEESKKGIYEVDVIITASSIAKGILNVVKGHAKSLSIAFAFIIEAAKQEELPETVLCKFQIHALDLDDCPRLPEMNLDDI